MLKRRTILTIKANFFYFKLRKNWKRAGNQNEYFRVTISLWVTVI